MTRAINERRPAPASADLRGSRATSKRNHREGTADRAGSHRGDSVIPPRLEWAAALIDRATGHVPEYGSPEFEALPDNSPEKVASCVRAAEAWRGGFSPPGGGPRPRGGVAGATPVAAPPGERGGQPPGPPPLS